MSDVSIPESGMNFGPFAANDVWQVESCALYERIKEGVQIAEFVLLRQGRAGQPVAWIVEAKSSSPRPETQPNFDEFIEEIRSKLSNAFTLTVATRLERFEGELANLPAGFQQVDLKAANFTFILIIKGHQDAWLESIQNAMVKAMKGLVKTWNLPPSSVAVLNEEGAREKGLILGTNQS